MSFFSKVLSSVGIGAATVDARLDTHEIEPGQDIDGVIFIQGGKADQEINKIDLDLMCNYSVEVEIKREEDGESYSSTEIQERHHKLGGFSLRKAFTIGAGEAKEIPFRINLPEQAPLTIGHTQTWLATNLDIAMAVDKQDQDTVTVMPTRLQYAVIEALEEMGFELDDAECEGSEKTRFASVPFIQEFEFKPLSGPYRGKFDEVEVVFLPQGEQLEVLLEIDRKARGFSGFFAEVFDRDEIKTRLSVNMDNIEQVPQMLEALLD